MPLQSCRLLRKPVKEAGEAGKRERAQLPALKDTVAQLRWHNAQRYSKRLQLLRQQGVSCCSSNMQCKRGWWRPGCPPYKFACLPACSLKGVARTKCARFMP